MTINRIDTKGWWMVGSNHIYVPSINTKVEHSNVVGSGSGRDDSGIMHIDWLRRDVRKVNLHYAYMTAPELSTLFNLLQGKEYTFKFYDKGSVQTISAYTGECSYDFYTYGADGTPIYADVQINVIEK